MSELLHLDPASVDAIARRVAELLGEALRSGCARSQELVDAGEISRRFGVSRNWAYENAAELRAIRLGSGPKARLRFDPAIVSERLNACSASKGSAPAENAALEPKTPRRRRRVSGAKRDLLPIKAPWTSR